jgi:5-methylcytosine-specific restriction enzyme A
MPSAALAYCSVPRCPHKVAGNGKCAVHAQEDKARHARFYTGTGINYGRPWRRAVKAWLNEDPSRILCAHCKAEGIICVGTETDHIVPHRGDPELFWDRNNNWQRLCAYHHSKKTAREVGFARKA